MYEERIQRVRVLISLLVACVQGAALYGLHHSIDLKQWPATNLSWLALFYAIATFAPLTVQLMSERWRSRLLWWVTAAIAVLFGYFGWHYGSVFGPGIAGRDLFSNDSAFENTVCLTVLWFLLIAFLRTRLVNGRWASDYRVLFSSTWQNTLMLMEAAVFTAVFWALLELWAGLFKMLGIEIFDDLFNSPEFSYPFTTLAFGLGLYMTGSVERLVSVTREQLLGLLRWLTPVAALILVLFTPTLVFKLPSLVFEGERAINAQWLLWLGTFTVLLYNAAYQNGAVEKPYPGRLQMMLRLVIPLLLVIAGTAVYSLFVRVSLYGLSADRVYACVVALIACIYAVGYTQAAIQNGPWLKGIERVNVAAAVTVMLILTLLLTPIASPYRLSANSQLRRVAVGNPDERRAALRYLRFESGRYGRSALYEIVNGRIESKKEGVSDDAKRVLAAKDANDPSLEATPQEVAQRVEVYPAGRSLEPDLALEMSRTIGSNLSVFNDSTGAERPALAVYVDLDGDAIEDCVVLAHYKVAFFQRRDQKWSLISQQFDRMLADEKEATALRRALAEGNIHLVPRRFKDVRIGTHVFGPEPTIDDDNKS